MTELLRTQDVFDLLATRLPGYEAREQQLDLSLSIEYAFKSKKLGVFEAGTGTGKSLAALIPAILSRRKVVVSTNTIALQEQYIHKDIPVLQSLLPFEFKAALLKGRNNYLGLRRWDEATHEFEVDNRIIDWVHDTTSGDVSELEFVPPWDLWQEVNSDGDDCLRQRCARYNDCFYFDAKKQAESADILVVNHALLLADAASSGGILPPYELLIVDEAHHLAEVATDCFSSQISNRGVRNLATRAIKKVAAPPHLIHDLEITADEFFRELAVRFLAPKVRLKEPVDKALELAGCLSLLKKWLEEQTFEYLMDYDQAREKAKAKAKAIISTINRQLYCLGLVAEPDSDYVVWVTRKGPTGLRCEINAAPLDVSGALEQTLLTKSGLESSIWMSATLATTGDDPFNYFKKNVGIARNVVQTQVPSPFNYAEQAMLYLPKSLPEPNQRDYITQAASEIERIIEFSGGRAFVLFTSHSALIQTFEMLAPTLPYECKRQGEMPRHKLIEWFKATPSAVLFGSSSFWEGVSVDGDQLSCVIIDRIPFQVPDDPIYEARCDLLKDDPSASWFNDLALPHATMRLKQGVGRLIRTRQDRGIVAILDPRLITKAYGRRIIECLPPMRIVRDLNTWQDLDHVFAVETSA